MYVHKCCIQCRIRLKVFFLSPYPQVHYTDKIPFIIRQNTDTDLCLTVQGYGSEPRLDFDHTLVAFTPILPFSPGAESEVTVRNPMSYPVEFYSLEFDKQYLEEEEVGDNSCQLSLSLQPRVCVSAFAAVYIC